MFLWSYWSFYDLSDLLYSLLGILHITPVYEAGSAKRVFSTATQRLRFARSKQDLMAMSLSIWGYSTSQIHTLLCSAPHRAAFGCLPLCIDSRRSCCQTPAWNSSAETKTCWARPPDFPERETEGRPHPGLGVRQSLTAPCWNESWGRRRG